MLTETFYYSHPNDLKGRIRNITVYFDTQFLTRALGYAHRSLEIPCFELVDMLKSLGVRMKCFEATFDELHRIIYACEQRALKYGRVADSRPGSVGDYFNRRNMDAGDIAVEISKLKERLQRLRIDIVPEPKHTEDYGIAEGILSEQIAEAFSFQSEEGRNHDVDCITAIHRLRKGKAQQHLESCVAIFVTTNATLAKITTNFFKEQYGRSDVSICMPDQAFTFLIWLKAVKKAPNLPRHRLVANCFAALQPTNQLWQRYIAEAKKLLDSEEIGETDYAELIHSIHAQETLMDVTMGDTDFVFGNVQEILEHAKAAEQQKYISLLGERDSTIIEQDRKLTEFEDRVSQISEKLVLWISCFMVAGLYLFGLLATKPPQLTYASLFSKNNAVFLFMVVVTLISTIGIFNIYTQLEKLARSAGNYLAAMVSRRLRL